MFFHAYFRGSRKISSECLVSFSKGLRKASRELVEASKEVSGMFQIGFKTYQAFLGAFRKVPDGLPAVFIEGFRCFKVSDDIREQKRP